MEFKLETIEEGPRKVVLALAGVLSIYTARQARDLLEERLDAPELVLDLSQIQEFDSAGAQLLLYLRRECAARGGVVRAENRTVATERFFTLYNLTEMFA